MFVLFAAIFPRFPNRLADVTALSDEENNTNLTRCVPVPPKIPRRPCQGFRKRQQNNLLQTADDRQKLSYLIRGKCGCQCDCFGPFRSMPLLGQWLELRKILAEMTKLEKDDHVVTLAIYQHHVLSVPLRLRFQKFS